MTEETVEIAEEEVAAPVESELDNLKARADLMGISYHPSIGLDKLKAKVDEKMEPKVPEVSATHKLSMKTGAVVPATFREQMAFAKKQASRLIRVRVSCMNPDKREYEGEIFDVGNSHIGMFKKYVPYNNEAGFHIPNIIYETMRDRMCQIFINGKDDRGNKIRKSKQIKEFNIEVLTPLDKKGVDTLAKAQAAAHSID